MSVRKLNGNMNVIGTNLRHYRKAKHLSEANKRTVKDYELCGFVKILYITFEDLFYKIDDILDSY